MADPAPAPSPPTPVPTDPAFLASHAKLVAALDKQGAEMARLADNQVGLQTYFAQYDAGSNARTRRAELLQIAIAIMGERMTATVKPSFATVVADAAALQAEVDKRLASSPTSATPNG